MRTKLTLPLLLVLTVSAAGQSVYIDYGTMAGGAPAPPPGYTAALPPDAASLNVWNGLAGPDGGGLVDAETGAPTPVAIDGPAGGNDEFDDPAVLGSDELLMDDRLNTGPGGGTFTVSNVAAGTYDIYTYAWGPDIVTGTAYLVLVNGSHSPTQLTHPDGAWPNGFVQGITHTVHTGVVVDAVNPIITISVQFANGSGDVVVNGIQIVPARSQQTYQGYLDNGGNPANGPHGMRFRLYANNVGGLPLRTWPITGPALTVLVSNGLFSAPLSFGSNTFSGGRRWLEVEVNGQVLSPRQEITATPYAVMAGAVNWGNIRGAPSCYAPCGAAGGDLEGSSYPDPVVAPNAISTSKLAAAAVTTAKISGSGANTAGQALTWNGSSVVWGTPVGTLALPFSGSVASGVAFNISATSASDVSAFTINNAASGAECVDATSNGGGNVIEASMTGAGRAGFFQISNATNTFDCLTATGNGTGNTLATAATGTGIAASVSNTSAANNNPALDVSSAGSPTGNTGTLNCVNTGAGRAAYLENNSSAFYTLRVQNLTAGSLAAQFVGNVAVTGNLSASGTKPFRIDHPLDPANRYLYHYALESPEVLNVYRGSVVLDAAGEAWVQLPDYFEALNRAFDYQLTPIGAAMPDLHVAGEITGGRFRIAGGKADRKVSWQVTATRNDAYVQHYGAPVEVDKAAGDKGLYLNPEVFGQPLSLGIGRGPSEGGALNPKQNDP